MATRQRHQIIETPTEARQGEPGPSVLALLTISTGLAVLILGVVWFVFFRTRDFSRKAANSIGRASSLRVAKREANQYPRRRGPCWSINSHPADIPTML